MTSVNEHLLGEISKLPVVDTHEHLMSEGAFETGIYDFSHIMGTYVGLDLGLAGMPHGPWGGAHLALLDGSDPGEKWSRIAPYWAKVRDTRYGVCARRILKRFFDVSDLNEHTCVEISKQIPEYQYPGVYKEYLQTKHHIKVCLRVGDDGGEPQYFAPICYLDTLAGIVNRDELEAAFPDRAPSTYDEFLSALDSYMEKAEAAGAVSLKLSMISRRRPIDFVEHTASEISDSYNFLLGNHEDWHQPHVMDKLRPFHDSSFRHCFEWAGKHDMPVQVHSGLEFEQPWNGNPGVFIPCLTEFRETRFAILHGSYPYMAELTGLARSFDNVYIDMAWVSSLSGPLASMWLDEWLDILPTNKIMGFGGDALSFFETCVCLEMTNEMLASVFSKRIERGRCSTDQAIERARILLHDAPWDFYQLGSRWKGRSI
jgi:hypothetical protein